MFLSSMLMYCLFSFVLCVIFNYLLLTCFLSVLNWSEIIHMVIADILYISLKLYPIKSHMKRTLNNILICHSIYIILGWSCCSMVKCFLSMWAVLSLIPSTTHKNVLIAFITFYYIRNLKNLFWLGSLLTSRDPLVVLYCYAEYFIEYVCVGRPRASSFFVEFSGRVT